jgi:hypothetical protein
MKKSKNHAFIKMLTRVIRLTLDRIVNIALTQSEFGIPGPHRFLEDSLTT